MPVSPDFAAYVLEQLGRIVPVTSRRMFGGIGIYGDGLFFALIDDDTLYLKVDDATRPAFEAAGMEPFRPYGDDRAMAYYTLPGDALEDVELLAPWVDRAMAAARRQAAGKRRRSS
ncbi:MAG TPA: TfoX/Sxy family protein [Longimicrobiales bacterium]